MNTKLIIKFLCVFNLLSILSYSQNKISGIISDNKGNPLTFVTVYLTDINDSTKILNGTISDFYGNFSLSHINKGKYFFYVSSIEYETYKNIIFYSGYDTIINASLKLKTIPLNEVNIKENSVFNSASSTTFVMTKKDIDKYTSTFNMMTIIPKIKVDEINKKIKTYSDENVKILINGINADERDVMALKPCDIIKFEYYEIPPARFSTSDISSVVNIITRKAVEGIEISTDIQNALFTGFSNDLLTINYNRIKYQFKFQYSLNYRDYKNMKVNETLKYFVNDTIFNFTKIGINSPMNYSQNDISISFTANKENNYVLNLKFTPDFYNGVYKTYQNIFLAKNDINDYGLSKINVKLIQFNPGIDIYIMKKLMNNDEITFNIVSNLFSSKYENNQSELSFMTNSSLLNYSIIKGDKISIISEICYTIPFKKFNFNTGIRNAYNQSKYNDISNIINITTETIANEGYIYSEITGTVKKISYLGNIGLSLNSLNEDYNINNYFFKTIRSDIAINYKISDFSGVKLSFLLKPITPSLSELSNNYYYKESYFYLKGNPKLRPYNYNESSIEYSVYKSIINFSGELSYKFSKGTILPQFVYNDEYILQTYNNQINEREFSASSFLQLNPFKKNWLNLILFGKIFHEENKMDNSSLNSINGSVMATSLSLTYRKWSFRYAYQSKIEHLNGDIIKFDPNTTIISLQYKMKNLFISGEIYFAFEKSYHTSYSVQDVIMKSNSTSDIFDNGNMLVLNLSYNFSYGKGFSQYNRKMLNNDTDSGILKPY